MGDREIDANAALCQSAFVNLLSATKNRDPGSSDLPLVRLRDVKDLQERFHMWAGGFGALLPPNSPLSLEHRLQLEPVVREWFLKLLANLHESLQKATDIVAGRRTNKIAEPFTYSDAALAEYDISSDSEASTSSEPCYEYCTRSKSSVSEIDELMAAVKHGVDNLNKTSVFIPKSLDVKRQQAWKTTPIDNRMDIAYIKDQFPLMAEKNEALVTRLGEANARRRLYFKYCREHHDQSSGMDKEMPDATTMASLVTSATEIPEDSLVFPPLPTEAEADFTFLCPYCFSNIPIDPTDKLQQWREHILEDLEPYICTFPTCGVKTYQSEDAWFEHELVMHRHHWRCPKCFEFFESSQALEEHIAGSHDQEIPAKHMPFTIELSKRHLHFIQPGECPFCEDEWSSAKPNLLSPEGILVVDAYEFQRHLGHHLIEVALASLPRLKQGQNSKGHNPGACLGQEAALEGQSLSDASRNLATLAQSWRNRRTKRRSLGEIMGKGKAQLRQWWHSGS